MPRPERLAVFLDAVQSFISSTFGPDETPAEVRITTQPPSVLIVTDHGGRVTIDTIRNPGSN